MTCMSRIVIDQITKRFSGSLALNEVCLDIAAGEFATLLGPSGCGKSTTLRAVAGLTSIDSGRILMGDADVTRLPIHRRNIGMVFQNHALFPHMSVADNVGFGLKMRRIGGDDRGRRIADALEMVRLGAFGARFPHQLSGGQQQRVAIARALVINPAVLLMDEPFAALDRKLRQEMQVELRELTRRVGITAIFVTHDQEEALTLSDKVVLMNGGRIEQVGTPDDVYAKPETPFAADFMGAGNILEAELVGQSADGLTLAWEGVRLSAAAPVDYWLSSTQSVSLALRSELVRIAPAESFVAAPNTAAGTIVSRIDQGAFLALTVSLSTGGRLLCRHAKTTPGGAGTFASGSNVTLHWDRDAVVVLRAQPRSQPASG